MLWFDVVSPLTEIKTYIKMREYLLLKASSNSVYKKNKLITFFNPNSFEEGDDVLIIPYNDEYIEDLGDEYIIEVSVNQIIVKKIKKDKNVKNKFLLTFNTDEKTSRFLLVKHPVSNDVFTGTELITMIETDDYFIRKCRVGRTNCVAYIPMEYDNKYKRLLALPIFEDETRIYENEDGNYVIQSFVDEFKTDEIKHYDSNHTIYNLPCSWMGLDVLFVEAPN